MLASVTEGRIGLRNRYHRLPEREPFVDTPAFKSETLPADRCAISNHKERSEIQKRLMEEPLAHVALRPKAKTKRFTADLATAIADYRSATVVSSCLDGSKPYAEVRLRGRDAYLTVQVDDRSGGADLRLYSKQGGRLAPWQDGWDDASASDRFMHHVVNYLIYHGADAYRMSPLVALSLLSDRLRAAVNERTDINRTLKIFR